MSILQDYSDFQAKISGFLRLLIDLNGHSFTFIHIYGASLKLHDKFSVFAEIL